MRSQPLADQRERTGYTLVETLVTIGVMAVGASLLMPAVQSAREAARRAGCTNNLRQIGISLQSYHAAWSSFPISTMVPKTPRTDGYGGFYSAHARLLPYLERSSIYDGINFDIGSWPAGVHPVSSPEQTAIKRQSPRNTTAITTRVGVFLCPSDRVATRGSGVNYRCNAGVGPHYGPLAEYPDSGNGLMMELLQTSAAHVLDGLSHTVALSERIHGSGQRGEPSMKRDLFLSQSLLELATISFGGRPVAASDKNRSRNAFVDSGGRWFWPGGKETHYTHTDPNGVIPDLLRLRNDLRRHGYR